jgi:hypothetical protein
VSGEPWLAHPSPPLVPFPLDGLLDGGPQWVSVATRGGAVCNGYGVTGKYAVSVVTLINH